MKKIILLLLMIFSVTLVSCSVEDDNYLDNAGVKKLNNVIYPEDNGEEVIISEEAINKLYQFNDKVISGMFEENKNYVYSPLSIYMALSMLTEGSTNDCYDELSSLLGESDIALLRENMKKVFEATYTETDKTTVFMANSIWTSNMYDIKDSYVNNLAKNYYAEALETDFTNSKTPEAVAKWINDRTNNILGVKKESFAFNQDTLLLLINTIYFKGQWRDQFEKHQISEGIFKTNEGEESVNFLNHDVRTRFYQSSDYQMAEDYFEDGYKIVYILPTEGNDITTLIKQDSFLENAFASYKEQSTYSYINLKVPKFETKNSYDVLKSMRSLGVASMLIPSVETFKNIIDNQEVFVSGIKHEAGLSLDETGVEAAAYTAIQMDIESVEPEATIYFHMDRPFAYVITDNNNLPLFVGVTLNPNE